MSARAEAPRRADFAWFTGIDTRWMDNDVYGHVNNVAYLSWFDTAVNRRLIEEGALDLETSPVIGLVVETRCSYFAPVSFPDRIWAGLKVEHLGRSSVRYRVGLFRNDEDSAAAAGEFTHVYVDRVSRTAVEIPAEIRASLQKLAP